MTLIPINFLLGKIQKKFTDNVRTNNDYHDCKTNKMQSCLSKIFNFQCWQNLKISPSLTQSIPCSLTHLYSITLTQSLTHSLTHTLSHTLTYSLMITNTLTHFTHTHILTHSLILNHSHSLTHLPTDPSSHSPTHSLTHTLTYRPASNMPS